MADPKKKAEAVAATKGLTPQEKSGCMVRPCEGCLEHEYQDTKYGHLKRVKNFSKNKGWACTVCSRYEGSGVAASKK